MPDIKTATSDSEINSCWEATYLLRPMLKKEDFLSTIQQMQREGYTLLYMEEDQKTVAVAGYHIFSMLYCGKCCISTTFPQ